VTFDPTSLRRPRGEVWIAAAGPAATFVAGAVLWLAWLGSGSDSLARCRFAMALVSTDPGTATGG